MSGLLEQINRSNISPYNQLTEKQIKKFIKDLELADTEKPRDKKTGRFLKGPRVKKKQREFVVYGGQGFYDEFNKAMEKQAKNYGRKS